MLPVCWARSHNFQKRWITAVPHTWENIKKSGYLRTSYLQKVILSCMSPTQKKPWKKLQGILKVIEKQVKKDPNVIYWNIPELVIENVITAQETTTE